MRVVAGAETWQTKLTDSHEKGSPIMATNNVRFVPVQRFFKAEHGFDSWRVQDVEQINGCEFLCDDEGLILCFYRRERAQEYADQELARQQEYEEDRRLAQHSDATMLEELQDAIQFGDDREARS